jgi:hypothetical protein
MAARTAIETPIPTHSILETAASFSARDPS